jgi:hypothetical protein
VGLEQGVDPWSNRLLSSPQPEFPGVRNEMMIGTLHYALCGINTSGHWVWVCGNAEMCMYTSRRRGSVVIVGA